MSHLARSIAFSLFLFCFSAINAQSGFHIGVGGSLNSSWIVSQNNFETLSDCEDPLIQSAELAYELTLGYTVGGMMGYNFNDRHGIQLGMQYSKAGQDYKDGFTSLFCPEHAEVLRMVDLSYFQMPVQYKLNGGRDKRIKPYLMMGFQFNFLIASEERVLLSGTPKENFQVAAADKFQNFDFGLAIDGGVDFYLTDDIYLNTGFTVYAGLSDINGVEVSEFVSKNDEVYKASRNYKFGLHLGIHYLFQSYRRRAAW